MFENIDLKAMSLEELKTLLEDTKLKRDYHDVSQMALKNASNSAYGSFALEINTFSHGKGYSCAVTTSGRMSNRWCTYKICEGIDKLLNKKSKNLDRIPYSIQNDTDSSYVDISALMKKKGLSDNVQDNLKLANKIAERLIQPFIQEGINDIYYTLNALNHSLKMEQELIMDSFVSIADKRYFARYYKNGKPKHKITGLSLISKSTPPWCKEKLKPVLDIVLDKDPHALMDYIQESRLEFDSQPIETISTIKGVSSIDYEWNGDKLQTKKNGKLLSAPINSRAAILHNEFIAKNNLRYENIRGGDKVYLTNLKTPNPVKSQDIIGYSNPKFMEESGLMQFVDYDTLFDKHFLKNIQLITDPINWSLDMYQSSMDEWV